MGKKKKEKKPKCRTCEFCELSKPTKALCHRFPPGQWGGTAIHVPINVDPEGWCGEHVERKKKKKTDEE